MSNESINVYLAGLRKSLALAHAQARTKELANFLGLDDRDECVEDGESHGD